MAPALPSTLTTFVALLRGINVGGHRRVPMEDLRSLCSELGFTDVKSYIQSGNLVFRGSGSSGAVEAALERSIERHFGFPVEVLVRTARQWRAHAAGNPFAELSRMEGNRVMLLLSKALPRTDAASELAARATAGEQVIAVRDVLWIHFPEGVGSSKLTPQVLDRLVGSSVTARNWKTVATLEEMARG